MIFRTVERLSGFVMWWLVDTCETALPWLVAGGSGYGV